MILIKFITWWGGGIALAFLAATLSITKISPWILPYWNYPTLVFGLAWNLHPTLGYIMVLALGLIFDLLARRLLPLSFIVSGVLALSLYNIDRLLPPAIARWCFFAILPFWRVLDLILVSLLSGTVILFPLVVREFIVSAFSSLVIFLIVIGWKRLRLWRTTWFFQHTRS